MNTWTSIMSWLLAGAAAMAASLPKESVSADAKWFVHVDMAEFNASRLGQTVAPRWIEPEWPATQAKLRQLVDADLDWRKLASVTVYGTDFNPERSTVAIVKVDAGTQQLIEAALRKHAEKSKETDAQITEEAGPNGPIFQLAGQVMVAAEKRGVFVLSKHRDTLEKASEVLAGKAANLTGAKTFGILPSQANGFFFAAVAEGFGGDRLPAQAKILQQADGGHLSIGEADGRLRLSVTLTGKTPEVCQQIVQVIQGVQALTALGQNQNPELVELANSTKVSSTGKAVSVGFELPVEKVLAQLDLQAKSERAKKPSKGKGAGKARKVNNE